MKLMNKMLLICAMLIIISGCKHVDRFSILKQCTVLGDESIVYARAHYVKLFYHFNPDKFSEAFKQIDGFDAVSIFNTIDTYNRAVDKLSIKTQENQDLVTQNLLDACKTLFAFSKDFVENSYPTAINYNSENKPNTDEFFIEINQLVKFDHKIGAYDKNKSSFKQNIESYKAAVDNYIKEYRKSIPSDFLDTRKI